MGIGSRLALLCGISLLVLAAPAHALSITELPPLIAGSAPEGIAAGPDGDVWFTENGGSRIGRVIPSSGHIDDFSTGSGISAGSQPHGITAGPDGRLWFAEQAGNRIGAITTTDNRAHEYSAGISAAAQPVGIATGADDNLWFTESNKNQVGRMLASTQQVTEWSVSLEPSAIAAGPDGNLWFTHQTAAIGRITTGGTVTEFTSGLSAGAKSNGIAAGPDGNMWFTDVNDRIGRITPAGVITEFSTGISSGGIPFGITLGPDGNLWFTELNGRVGRITPAGVITEFYSGITGNQEYAIVTGPDQNLWFTERGGNRIARVVLDPAAISGAASAVGTGAATLAGTVNPYGADTSYAFEYGTTAGQYDGATESKIVKAGSGATQVAMDIGGLRPGTTYHYRLAAAGVGGTTFDADRTFTTTTSGSVGGSGAGGGSASPDRSGPAMRVLTRSLVLAHNGRVQVSLACPLAETLGCSGTATLDSLKKGGRAVTRLGRASFRVGAGQSHLYSIKLSHAEQRLVRKLRQLGVELIVRATDSAHNHRTTTKRLTLRAG